LRNMADDLCSECWIDAPAKIEQGRYMNPCWEEFFLAGGTISNRKLREWEDEDEYRIPFVDRHVPGCDGRCNYGPDAGGLPPAVVFVRVDAGESKRILWISKKFAGSAIEGIKLAQKRGWILDSSDHRFNWGNYGDEASRWFFRRFGIFWPDEAENQGFKEVARIFNSDRGFNHIRESSGDPDAVDALKEF